MGAKGAGMPSRSTKCEGWGWRGGCGVKGDFSSQRDSYGRGVNDAKRQRGPGRKHSSPGSGAARVLSGAVP
jgi:hypothetical protein